MFLITMNGESGPAILAEVLCDVVGNPFRADEDEDLCVFLTNLVEMFDELIAFLKLAAQGFSSPSFLLTWAFSGKSIHSRRRFVFLPIWDSVLWSSCS